MVWQGWLSQPPWERQEQDTKARAGEEELVHLRRFGFVECRTACESLLVWLLLDEWVGREGERGAGRGRTKVWRRQAPTPLAELARCLLCAHV